MTAALIPYRDIYLSVSTGLTLAGEAVVDVAVAVEERNWVGLVVIFLDAVAEVIGGSFMVSGIEQASFSNGRGIAKCQVKGAYDNIQFEMGMMCGGECPPLPV